MIVVVVFLSILNQTEFKFVQYLNVISFGLESKGKLSLQSYSNQSENRHRQNRQMENRQSKFYILSYKSCILKSHVNTPSWTWYLYSIFTGYFNQINWELICFALFDNEQSHISSLHWQFSIEFWIRWKIYLVKNRK